MTVYWLSISLVDWTALDRLGFRNPRPRTHTSGRARISTRFSQPPLKITKVGQESQRGCRTR